MKKQKTQPDTQSERIRQAMRRRQEHEKQELRQAILTAAGQLFLEQGYDRFSMRKVAERIGYSPTTIYLYFRDKDDLLFTIVDEGFEQFGQQLMIAAQSTADPWERLLALGRAYVSFGIQHPMYYELMFMQRSNFLMQAPQGESTPRIQAFNILKEGVQQALDAGRLHPGSAQAYSDLLWALMHGLVSLSISVPLFDAIRLQQALAESRLLIERGLHRG
ncbi:TetR family transcriptional regulator [Ktedonobacter sp. SOSP1-85]|uniref:TetR/AcrR family transcriptional regulator n=1 Tax=Ktedonobacter sp. SOSP1-85 TaxID=2778367 RepID=UPI00191529A8|nr:TetR/AcrR family transcriptional regulator [Ktedonobacter sp. SOSP1-85]GHO77688.1 TetR family transcriptional regulator [Ktedonobacter sp. SOSP1-85]